MFRAYGAAPAETPSTADIYPWTAAFLNKGAFYLLSYYMRRYASLVSERPVLSNFVGDRGREAGTVTQRIAACPFSARAEREPARVPPRDRTSRLAYASVRGGRPSINKDRFDA